MEKIRIENVSKVFGKTPELGVNLINGGKTREEILKDHGLTLGVNQASFSIDKGEIFVIMGLSGSGKSTMVRMLNRLIQPTSGKIFFDNQDITEFSLDELVEFRRDQVSMVFQSFALMPHLNILDNTCLGLEFAGVDRLQREQRALEQLQKVGLKGWERNFPGELSGGMRQRVGLARALTAKTQVLLMDEAFSALDPLIRSEMQDELLNIHREDRRTIVFISHDLDEALKLGDRIAIMNEGKVIQVGTPKEIIMNPADEYVEAFFKGVDYSRIITAKEVCRGSEPLIFNKPIERVSALKEFEQSKKQYAVICDESNRFLGICSHNKLRQSSSIESALIKAGETITEEMNMQDILGILAQSEVPLPVIDKNKDILGIMTKDLFLKKLADINGSENV